MFIDTHCHLDFKRFNKDRVSVLERARSRNVVVVINPGVDISSSRRSVELAQEYEEVYAAVGIHPNSSQHWQDAFLEELDQLASSRKVCAIGEIGLDYYRDYSPKRRQWDVLQIQLELAAKLDLPVIIHSRDKREEKQNVMFDLQTILKDWKVSLAANQSSILERPGVLHSFSGTEEEAEMFVELGFLIGVTGPVTYPNAGHNRKVVQSLPMEKLLIETDAPFLTPQPKRGTRNEPAYVIFTAEKISELHGLTLQETGKITTENARKLFRL